MDKQTFFHEFHTKLAGKHGVGYEVIRHIRSSAIGDNKSRKEVAEWIAVKISLPKRHKVFLTGKKLPHSQSRTHNKEYYQTLLNFVASCSSEAWADITQKTSFDKEGGERTTHQPTGFGNTAPTIQAHPHAE